MHQPINYKEINRAVMDNTMDMCGKINSLKNPYTILLQKLKDEDIWFNTDVIVSAAPELFDDYDEEQYRKVMTERIMMSLNHASQNCDKINNRQTFQKES